VPKQLSIKQFAGGLDHPEGLAFDSHGYLWSGGELGQLYRISPDGRRVETFAQLGGFCLGMAFSPDGDLFVCNHKLPAIVRVNTATGKHEIFADRVGKRKLRVPNYPVFDLAGNLYVSDSGDWGKTNGCVYRFGPFGKGELFAENLRFANGLALDAEGKNLFVAQSSADNVVRIPIDAKGRAGRAAVYASEIYSVPDGLAFDERGTLYISCYANSRIYAVTDRGVQRIVCEDTRAINLNRPTNLAFGGRARDRLYAANLGAYHISVINVGVKGQLLAGGPSR
jgi:gluconolactonase